MLGLNRLYNGTRELAFIIGLEKWHRKVASQVRHFEGTAI
jgi:hypothetical protein